MSNGSFDRPLLIGSRIGLVSDKVVGTSAFAHAIAAHEFLHTLGLAHPFQSGQSSVVVTSTSSSARTRSVLQNLCVGGESCAGPENGRPRCCFHSTSLTEDDVDTIDTLFSPLSSGSCAYVDGFQVVGPN